MGQPTKRDQMIRLAFENVLAELHVIRGLMPVHELRIAQVKQRTGWNELLDPALEEVQAINAGIDEISIQVHAGLQSMRGEG